MVGGFRVSWNSRSTEKIWKTTVTLEEQNDNGNVVDFSMTMFSAARDTIIGPFRVYVRQHSRISTHDVPRNNFDRLRNDVVFFFFFVQTPTATTDLREKIRWVILFLFENADIRDDGRSYCRLPISLMETNDEKKPVRSVWIFPDERRRSRVFLPSTRQQRSAVRRSRFSPVSGVPSISRPLVGNGHRCVSLCSRLPY